MIIEKAFTTVNTSKGIKHIDKETASTMYLDYVNNFITVQSFSEYYGIDYFSVKTLINKCRKELT